MSAWAYNALLPCAWAVSTSEPSVLSVSGCQNDDRGTHTPCLHIRKANQVNQDYVASALQDSPSNAYTDCAGTTRYCSDVLARLHDTKLSITLIMVRPSSLKRSLVARAVGAGNDMVFASSPVYDLAYDLETQEAGRVVLRCS
jgi:hypothetical protein